MFLVYIFLVGVVNHIRDTHVALLVDGMFSACIKRDQLDLWYTFIEVNCVLYCQYYITRVFFLVLTVK
jgi:hypothetical protein